MADHKRPPAARLAASTVEVLCPTCGEAQPEPEGGSFMWEPRQVEALKGHVLTCACGATMTINVRRAVAL